MEKPDAKKSPPVFECALTECCWRKGFYTDVRPLLDEWMTESTTLGELFQQLPPETRGQLSTLLPDGDGARDSGVM